jgi:hypothetical protein
MRVAPNDRCRRMKQGMDEMSTDITDDEAGLKQWLPPPW